VLIGYNHIIVFNLIEASHCNCAQLKSAKESNILTDFVAQKPLEWITHEIDHFLLGSP
jgi:hypothetical protein